MDPGTAAIITLASVGAMSGYGASVVNADQGKMIDDKVAIQVAAIKSKADKLDEIQQKLNSKMTETEQLQTRVKNLDAAIAQLQKEKASSESKMKSTLEKAQEGEILFKKASLAALMYTADELRKRPEIVTAIEESKQKEAVEKVLNSIKSKLMLIKRGTLAELFQKLLTANGGTPLIDRLKFMDTMTEILRGAEAGIKAKETAEKEAKKREAQAKKEGEQAKKAPAPEPAPEPEPQTNMPENEAEKKDEACKAVLASRGIATLSQYRKWMLANKDAPESEKAEVNDCVDRILKNRKGGMRKKKLRSRRGVKQNVRRSRSRKNRSNGTHPDSR